MSEIKRYSRCITHRDSEDTFGNWVKAQDHDAAIADKDKTIADLKRQLEDARDVVLREVIVKYFTYDPPVFKKWLDKQEVKWDP